MEEKLKNLYGIPDRVLPQDVYLLDLTEQCARLEMRVREILEKLSIDDQQTLNSYIDIRDELGYQAVKVALRFSKYVK